MADSKVPALATPTGGLALADIFYIVDVSDTTDDPTGSSRQDTLTNLQVLMLKPSANDAIALGTAALGFSDLFLAEGAVINWDNGDATLTQAGNLLTLAGADFVADNITVNTALLPDANDGAALGSATLSFSDLFLAEGAVINFDNGDATLTQAGNMLTLAGANFTADSVIVNTSLLPDANDGAALGTTALQFSDLFLAEGAVINFDNGDVTLTQVGNTLTLAGGTFVLPAGTTTEAPLKFDVSGSLMTTPDDGSMEMDANALYATTDGGNRGIVPIRHLIRANATRTFVSNTNQQAIFNNPANGTITLEAGTYLFKAFILITSTSATSGNVKFSLIGAGTATLGSILWHAVGADVASDSLVAMNGLVEVIATQTATNLHTATTATQVITNIDGTFEVTAAGTLIPSMAQTTAAAAVVALGSYFYCERIGDVNLTSVGQWT